MYKKCMCGGRGGAQRDVDINVGIVLFIYKAEDGNAEARDND